MGQKKNVLSSVENLFSHSYPYNTVETVYVEMWTEQKIPNAGCSNWETITYSVKQLKTFSDQKCILRTAFIVSFLAKYVYLYDQFLGLFLA